MNTSTRPRVDKGVPAGGEFTAFGHSDNVPALGAPRVTTDFVAHQLGEFGFTDHMSAEEIAKVTAELNASRDFRDENITAVADRIHSDTAGYTVSDAIAADEGITELTRLGREDWAESLRRVLGRLPERPAALWPANDSSGSISPDLLRRAADELKALPDGVTVPVPANDPRLLAGQVFDKVAAPDGTVFHRVRDGVSANEPYEMRIQANRPLREDEKLQMAGLLGYAYKAQVRGEGFSMPESDSPYSFIISVDTTKSASDDLGYAMERFEETIPEILQEGSPARKTNRTGPIGSRLVEGFNEPDLKIELYYDSVIEHGA